MTENRPDGFPRGHLFAWQEWRTLAEWAELAGLSERIVQKRLALGMTPELALSIPKQAHVDISVPPGYPKSWSWHALAFEDDEWAREFTRQHCRGASVEAVAEVLGITHNAAHLIERRAIGKLKKLHGPDVLRQVLRGER